MKKYPCRFCPARNLKQALNHCTGACDAQEEADSNYEPNEEPDFEDIKIYTDELQ